MPQKLDHPNAAVRAAAHAYGAVMNPEWNPLAAFPRVQRFQIMVFLSFMWTAIFSAMAGTWFVYGELLGTHLLTAVGVLVTSLFFERGRKRRPSL
ncbi:MAG: hypothetical protein R3360_03560 [Alphaproteobacteria bacterium]|nr:hypothetical protein [Alphaproteobacteria bacterium]